MFDCAPIRKALLEFFNFIGEKTLGKILFNKFSSNVTVTQDSTPANTVISLKKTVNKAGYQKWRKKTMVLELFMVVTLITAVLSFTFMSSSLSSVPLAETHEQPRVVTATLKRTKQFSNLIGFREMLGLIDTRYHRRFMPYQKQIDRLNDTYTNYLSSGWS